MDNDSLGAQASSSACADDISLRNDGTRSSPVLIDVRTEREFATTAIEGAINLPLPELAQRIGEFAPDPSTPITLYCASGARSGIGCMVLGQVGYRDVINAGGLYAAAAKVGAAIRR